jgi:hypothetical protein
LERTFQENFCKHFGTTYIASVIALECGVVDHHIRINGEYSTTDLEVKCPPPEIGAGKKEARMELKKSANGS